MSLKREEIAIEDEPPGLEPSALQLCTSRTDCNRDCNGVASYGAGRITPRNRNARLWRQLGDDNTCDKTDPRTHETA